MAQYDYIIIGAGSAGCVMANRLSANPSHRVLLLEAGGKDTNPFIHLPAGYAKTLKDPRVNWLYETEPDPGTDNRVHIWPRGKVLGGSSSINGLLYVRGQARDYDLWRQLGNEGWGWDDILPYFKKSEDYADGADNAHGEGGPLHVSNATVRHPISDAIIEAGIQAGLPRRDDVNTGEQEGISYFQLTVKNGLRCSAAVAYLRPAEDRPNLHVETHALAKSILLKDKQAYGVTYTIGDELREAHAGREVILCGGAINSPQILELSGIGPADLLKEKGIDVVHDLPGVGENLQDHFTVGIKYRAKGAQTLNELTRGMPLMKEVAKWVISRKGLLTMSPAQVQIYMRTRPELETPDVQHLFVPASMDGGKLSEEGKFELEREPGFTVAPILLRPESRGSIHIKTSDHQDYPAILPNYLSEEADCTTLIAALRWARELVGQEAMTPYRGEETSPGAEMTSDEDLLAHAKTTGSTIYHPVGTCKMGQDPMAVVDAQLNVHGVRKLRVVDASIMPRLISGNTNAPTMMIAEKAADMILNA